MGKFLRYFIGCVSLLVSGLAIAAGFNMRVPVYGVPAPPALVAAATVTPLTVTLTATPCSIWGCYDFNGVLKISGGVKPYHVQWVTTAYQESQELPPVSPWVPVGQPSTDGSYFTQLLAYPGWANSPLNNDCNYPGDLIIYPSDLGPGGEYTSTQEHPFGAAIEYQSLSATCSVSDGTGSAFRYHAVVTDSDGTSVTTPTAEMIYPGS